ncbi:MAG: polyprenyl synthetase family protein [Candidatus Saccharibacteria bacterium]|nr:polyprenyl synthetase family protein [Candidatus Saccharibacteria bacterium]
MVNRVDFKQELQQYQALINGNLANQLRRNQPYAQRLYDAMEYSLMAGGKRLRPVLVLAVSRLFNGDDHRCMPYALAIELVHNFSLIHDDLPGIDNDDFRHGQPTNHKQFDEATAVLAGDALLNQAYIVIADDLLHSKQINQSAKLSVLKEFSVAIDQMIAGEYVDTLDEAKTIDIVELEFIHRNKTGALLRLCARMGAMLARASDEDLVRVTIYAEKIGLAFQVKDDILSVEGDSAVTGKPVGNDEAMEKCTYVSEYGLAKAKEILADLVCEAKAQLVDYGDKANFLLALADYVQARNK